MPIKETHSIELLNYPIHRAVLIGNPNTGKTSLFNALTGMNQKVGNYSGVTVERKTGYFQVDGTEIELIDLPGTYSLSARSLDEAVVSEMLFGDTKDETPVELIIAIADASNLTRNFYLISQILELQIPTILVLNMLDLAEGKGFAIHADKLSAVLGIPVIPVSANKRLGLDKLTKTIQESVVTGGFTFKTTPAKAPAIQAAYQKLLDWVQQKNYAFNPHELNRALVDVGGYFEKRFTEQWGNPFIDFLIQLRKEYEHNHFSSLEAQSRYAWIAHILRECVIRPAKPVTTITDTLDIYFTHRIYGTALFIGIMVLLFHAVFSGAKPAMEFISSFFDIFGHWLQAMLPAGALQSLLTDGIVSGVGAIVVFVPQIAVLFFMISLLEDCGYLPRAAYLMDRIFSFCGLSGKSCIPLLSGFACAVPGIMAARTIENRRDRLVTIMITPLMSCSARLPVYLIFISAFIPDRHLFGTWISLQAAVLLFCYLIGIIVAIPAAWIFKNRLSHDEQSVFVLELPSYKIPSLRNVMHYVYEQSREFIVRAGTIIFSVSVLVWALAYFPHSAVITDRYEELRKTGRVEFQKKLTPLLVQFDSKRYENSMNLNTLLENMTLDNRLDMNPSPSAESSNPLLPKQISDEYTEYLASLADLEQQEKSAYLQNSYLGRMGKLIEPAVSPAGWDWRIGMAVLASFPAREIVVSSLGTILTVGDDPGNDTKNLRIAMQTAKKADGSLLFTIPAVLSILVYFALCCQCAATLAAIYKETQSWKWPVFTFGYMTVLAYLGAVFTYQITLRLF